VLESSLYCFDRHSRNSFFYLELLFQRLALEAHLVSREISGHCRRFAVFQQ